MSDIVKYQPQELTTIDQILDGDVKSLARIRKENGEAGNKIALRHIVKLIEYVQGQLNFDKKLDDDQIVEAAHLLLKFNYDLSPEDIKLAFENGLTGKYRKQGEKALYSKIDVTDFGYWCGEYKIEKQAKIRMKPIVKTQEEIEEEKYVPLTEDEKIERDKILNDIKDRTSDSWKNGLDRPHKDDKSEK